MPKPKQSYSYVDDWKSLWEPDLEAIAYNGATCDPTRVDPKVLQWAKQNCSHKPHFIKIVTMNAVNGRPGVRYGLRNASGCQLSVPTPFVKEHVRELQRVVILENDDGKMWRVTFGAARTDPSWKQGWNRVAADNDLEPGEVIVIVLVANSHFHFTRFDEDGNLISGERSTHSTLNATTAVKKQFTTSTNPEDQSLHRRTSWKEKRATALALRIDKCAQPSGVEFDRYGHEASQVLASFDKQQIAEYLLKRRRLCKVGEIKSKSNSNNDSNMGINRLSLNEHPLYDSEEAGSTSMAAEL